MVYYFTSNVVDPPATIYVGKDKFENEDLIKFGWNQDVWVRREDASLDAMVLWLTATHHQFHVDKLSSAHVYLRMQDGQTWDTIDDNLITDLAQLTKANSIEGTHHSLTYLSPAQSHDNIAIVYTPWSNLKKTDAMEVGQVSYKDQREVKRVLVAQRENAIVNRLNKTKVEKKPDLQRERDDRLKELRRRDQEVQNQRRKEEARQAQEWKEKKWQKDHAYDDMFTEDNMAASSNQERGADWEDDFM
ncbi:hypothetical protein CP533_2784 [Ophiocordyceps camponoti-saundersi (nom. inval.)]|nr:hypothetical protein CP533_2784 [Ophiocordyceps camponoti-saundersi (nom. inval.)]